MPKQHWKAEENQPLTVNQDTTLSELGLNILSLMPLSHASLVLFFYRLLQPFINGPGQETTMKRFFSNSRET